MTIESSDGHEFINLHQNAGLHLRQLLNLLNRRRKVIIVAVMVAASLVGAVAWIFPPRYTAIAEVIVDPPRGGNGNGDTSAAGVLDDSAVQTHVAALLSDSHLRHVFDSLVAERGPGPKEQGGLPLLPPEEFSIENFTARINAFKDAHSRMVGITYRSTDPAFATLVANRSMELYLATLTERNIADRNEVLRSLSKRIPKVKAEVERADAALQSYRIKHGFTEASRMDMVDQQLSDLNRQLAVAKSDLAALRARPVPLNIGQAANQSQSTEESSTLEARVRQLERRIAVLQDAGNEMREPEAQLREMQREATTLAQLYDGLVQREKAVFEEAGGQPDIRILSPASIPTLPSSLNPLLFIPPAMVLALIGAALLALLLDQLDRTLRTERDVAEALGISCIGVVPLTTRSRMRGFFKLFSPRGWKAIGRAISQGLAKVAAFLLRRRASSMESVDPRPDDARYTEAIRSLVVTALHLLRPQAPPKTFLVTSSVAGEGKTTLAISFAGYAARIHRRVLLIDLSFRNPSIARELGGTAGEGILHVLQGRPVADLVRAAPGLGFDYLLLSRGRTDPVATLAGEAMPKLLRELRSSYDCVVIDSAPLLSATEARLLASMVDSVLFAVKWGATPRETAQNALGLLRRSPFGDGDLQKVSAVITQVDLKKHARYRYGDFSENLLQVRANLGAR